MIPFHFTGMFLFLIAISDICCDSLFYLLPLPQLSLTITIPLLGKPRIDQKKCSGISLELTLELMKKGGSVETRERRHCITENHYSGSSGAPRVRQFMDEQKMFMSFRTAAQIMLGGDFLRKAGLRSSVTILLCIYCSINQFL